MVVARPEGELLWPAFVKDLDVEFVKGHHTGRTNQLGVVPIDHLQLHADHKPFGLPLAHVMWLRDRRIG